MSNITYSSEIDKYNLIEENAVQPSLYSYYSEELTIAKQNRDNFMLDFKKQKAELELQIRRKEIDIGCKITEGTIKAYLEQEQSLCEMDKELVTKNGEVRKLENIVSTLEQRGKRIDSMVKLHSNNYFNCGKGVGDEIENDFRRDLKGE